MTTCGWRLALCCGTLALAGAVGAATPETARAKAARLELTKGVSHIKAEGLPGPVLCLSEEAFPIGECGHWEAGVKSFAGAGAFYGEGRVLYLGHPGYLTTATLADMPTLISNTVPWLAKGKANPTIVALYNGAIERKLKALGFAVTTVKSIDEAVKADIICTIDFRLDDVEKLRDFVKNGGGLFGAGLGWGWKQIVGRTGFAALGVNFGDNQVLAPMGILMGDMGTPAPDGDKGFPIRAEYADGTHTLDALRRLLADNFDPKKDKALKKQCVKTVTLTMDALPGSVSPELAEIFKGFAAKPGGDKQPTPADPIGPDDFNARLAQIVKKNAWQSDVARVWPADPAHTVYPGAVTPGAVAIEKSVTIDCQRPKWHFTGLYSPAGQALTVTLPEGAETMGLSVRIGTSKEDLTATQEYWKRAPLVSVTYPLKKRETTLATPYGGLVYIVVPDANGRIKNKKVDVAFTGGIMAPWFKLGRDTNESFARQLAETHAPMGEIEGDWFVVTLPTVSLKKVTDAKWVAEFWDKVMAGDKYFAQWREHKYAERICGDLQLECGWLHNGYPLMFHLSPTGFETVADRASLEIGEGAWGFFHEIGHNHQHADWTPEGTTEVTVNLFTCYTIEKICGQNMRDKRFLSSAVSGEKMVNDWIAKGKKFEDWKNSYFVALQVYLRIAEAFGWDVYPNTFKKYLVPGARKPRNNQEKWDIFAERISETANANVAKALAAWTIPISEATLKTCAKYPDAPESVTAGVDSVYAREDEELYTPKGEPKPLTGVYIGISLTASGVIEEYATRADIPGGEQDKRWKTDWLLLRRIEKTNGPVTLGAPDHPRNARQVELTRPYYIGVYEITQKQWFNIMGVWRDCPYSLNKEYRDARPVCAVSYDDLRGALNTGVCWPKTKATVAPESFIGRLRERVESRVNFDIPSEAEWEVACRAGSTNFWNNGTGRDPYKREGYKLGDSEHNLDRLGRYAQNGGDLPDGQKTPEDGGPDVGTAIVGSYEPNAWGLYDMHGNVYEYCRDWSEPDVTQPGVCGVDPQGPAEESPRGKGKRIAKGGGYSNFRFGGWGFALPGGREFGNWIGTGTRHGLVGCRVMMPAWAFAEARAVNGKMVLAPKAADARAAILDGVDSVAAHGFPSPLVCVGAEAFPLFAGRNEDKTQGVAAAAAFAGTGRVIAVGEPSILGAENARFVANAKKWLKGEGGGFASLFGGGKVKVVADAAALTDAECAELVSFVKNGDGLLIAGCAWKWQSAQEEATGVVPAPGQFPGNKVLAPLGLGVAGGGILRDGMDAPGFKTAETFAKGLLVADARELRQRKVYLNHAQECQVAHTMRNLAEIGDLSETAGDIPAKTRVMPKKAYPKHANGIAVAAGDRIVFLGDSITRLGGGKGGWIDKVLDGLKAKGIEDVEADRAGWDGQTSGDMLGRTDSLLAKDGVTWLVLSCGVNDVWGFDWQRGVMLPDYRRNVRGILDKAATRGVHVLLLTPTLIQEKPDNERNRILRDYVAFLREEATARGLLLCDMNKAETDALAALPQDGKKKFTYDGVHPVEAGHRLFAENILKALGVK